MAQEINLVADQPVVRPVTPGFPLYQSGLVKDPEVVRDRRLSQPERLRQLTHPTLLGLVRRDQAEYPEPSSVGDDSKGVRHALRLELVQRAVQDRLPAAFLDSLDVTHGPIIDRLR